MRILIIIDNKEVGFLFDGGLAEQEYKENWFNLFCFGLGIWAVKNWWWKGFGNEN